MIPVALASGSAAAYGLSDYLGGVQARRAGALRVICVSYPVSIVLVVLVAPLAGGSLTLGGALWGLASGVASGLAVWTFYAALARGPMSVVSPLTAVLSAAVPLAAGVLAGERPGVLALLGAALAIGASALVSLEGPPPDAAVIPRFTRRVAVLTVLAGLAFAAFFILLARVPAGEGLWPVALSRVGATVVVVAAALAGRENLRPGRSLFVAGAMIAVVDVVANVAFYYASQAAMLAVVSVIASLYPAFTVALALTHGGERVRPVQAVGMGIALLSVVLLAVG